ncbi:MAG: LysM peptidoglycan-binding domain-containing protein, partial [Anaerolineae bacterium]
MLIGLLLLSSLAACSKEQDPTPAASVSTSPSTNPVKDAEAESPTVATGSVVGLADAGSQPMPTPPPQVYTVQAGDTLSSISRKFGIDLDELIAINGITNPNLLQV